MYSVVCRNFTWCPDSAPVHGGTSKRCSVLQYLLRLLLCPALGPVRVASPGNSGNAPSLPETHFSLQNQGRWSCFKPLPLHTQVKSDPQAWHRLPCLSPDSLHAHTPWSCTLPCSLAFLLLPCPAAFHCQLGFSPKSLPSGLSSSPGYCPAHAMKMDLWWDSSVIERRITLKWPKLMVACGRGMDAQRAWGLACTSASSS